MESLKERQALTKMVMQLFNLWELSLKEQAQLLGYPQNSYTTISRLRNGGVLANKQNLLVRVGMLLNIHKSLRILFPQNRELVYQWITRPNKEFADRRPLDVMLEDEDGISVIRRYLEWVCCR